MRSKCPQRLVRTCRRQLAPSDPPLHLHHLPPTRFFPKASDLTFHFSCRHSRGKRSPLSENLAFKPVLRCGTKSFFPTKAFPESSHSQSSDPASCPGQPNSSVGVSPVSPKASPDYGADHKGPVLGLQQKRGLGSRFLLSSNIMQISKSN